MANNRGKAFEQVFRENWKKSFPGTFLYRFPDQLSGYLGSHNPSDFIAFNNSTLYLIECKSHEGNTIPFTAISQHEILKSYVGLEGIRSGVVLWMIDHDRVIYVPADSITKMKADGKKSINIKTIDADGYRYIEIPSVKKRVFMESDYTVMKDLQEGD